MSNVFPKIWGGGGVKFVCAVRCIVSQLETLSFSKLTALCWTSEHVNCAFVGALADIFTPGQWEKVLLKYKLALGGAVTVKVAFSNFDSQKLLQKLVLLLFLDISWHYSLRWGSYRRLHLEIEFVQRSTNQITAVRV